VPHHYRYNVHFSMLAQVGRFPPNELHFVFSLVMLHSMTANGYNMTTVSCPVPTVPWGSKCADLVWHAHPMSFCVLPLFFGPATSQLLQADTQSSLPFRWRCPEHLSRPCLTKSAISSKPKRPFKSTLPLESLKLCKLPQHYVQFHPYTQWHNSCYCV